ncbi:TPA: hypothetical protein SL458_003833 [Pseudomonas aeruginosa]|nr:hypothetical protein [Pseudomonas aeruginosa]
MVRQTGAAGTLSGESAPVTYVLDTTTPAPTLAFSNLIDTGALGDGVTRDDTFDLSLSGQEAGSTVVYEVSTDGGASWGR